MTFLEVMKTHPRSIHMGGFTNNQRDKNGWTVVLIVGDIQNVASLGQRNDLFQSVAFSMTT
jgi:hypothetical protein